MDELELSKIVGVGCAAMLAFVGLTEVSHGIVSVDKLETPAYAIEVAEDEGAVEEETISIAALMTGADAAAGKKVFNKCSSCHNATLDGAAKTGPNLWGILGRDIASTDGFAYSAALDGLDGDWNWENLNAFLTSPNSYAKGTKMKTFSGLKKDADRANVMAWLNAQSDAGIALPTE